jgi:hypothetical protein
MSNHIRSNNPFGTSIIGTAKIISAINIVTLECACKNILMGQMGIPIPCPSCNKVWFVSATAQIKVQEILADLEEKQSNLVSISKH